METTKAARMRTAPMSEIFSAPTLQRGPSMKSILVGLLAVFALSGCGVGVDYADTQEAPASTSARDLTANSTGTQTELHGPINQDPRTALPQDPIPVYTGSTIPTGGGRPTK